MVPLTITLEKAGAINVDVKVEDRAWHCGGYANGYARHEGHGSHRIEDLIDTLPWRKAALGPNAAVPWFLFYWKHCQENPMPNQATQQMLSAGAAMSRLRSQKNGNHTRAVHSPPLPYATSKNEPAIDAQTMQLHHDKHHAAYVNALNQAAGSGGNWTRKPLQDILAGLSAVPGSVRTTVRNNGGGHANHTMFWQIMGGRGGTPGGDVAAAIDRDLGGFTAMQNAFNDAGAKTFGSGWVRHCR